MSLFSEQAKRGIAPLSFYAFVDSYDGDIDKFIAKLKIARADNGVPAKSLKDKLDEENSFNRMETEQLKRFALQAGPPTEAALRLFGHFQHQAGLDNMPVEIVEMIAENLDDPLHVRNFSAISKEFRDNVSRRIDEVGNRLPWTNITSAKLQNIRNTHKAGAAERIIGNMEKHTFEVFYQLLIQGVFPFRYLKEIDEFVEGEQFKIKEVAAYEPLFVLNYDIELFSSMPAVDIFEQDLVHAPIDQLKYMLAQINRWNSGPINRGVKLDAELLDKITTYDPVLRDIALNRVKAYVNYATFCMSQWKRAPFTWVSTLDDKRDFRSALVTHPSVKPFAVGILKTGVEFKVPDVQLDDNLLQQFVKVGNDINREYRDLCKQGISVLSELLFGWPNKSGDTADVWLRPLAIEWLMAFPFLLTPQNPLEEQVSTAARAIGTYLLLLKVAPDVASNTEEAMDVWFSPSDETLVKILLSGGNNSVYVPLWWKDKHIRLIMQNRDQLDLLQVEYSLQNLYKFKVNKQALPSSLLN